MEIKLLLKQQVLHQQYILLLLIMLRMLLVIKVLILLGTKELVPATTATRNCFLRGDGQWVSPTDNIVDGNIKYDDITDYVQIYYDSAWRN